MPDTGWRPSSQQAARDLRMCAVTVRVAGRRRITACRISLGLACSQLEDGYETNFHRSLGRRRGRAALRRLAVTSSRSAGARRTRRGPSRRSRSPRQAGGDRERHAAAHLHRGSSAADHSRSHHRRNRRRVDEFERTPVRLLAHRQGRQRARRHRRRALRVRSELQVREDVGARQLRRVVRPFGSHRQIRQRLVR